jgi:microcystin-dependent protein
VKYAQPLFDVDPDAPYLDANPGTGQDGSVVPARGIENPQRELDHLISFAGLTPNHAVLTQVRQAVQALAAAAAAKPPGTLRFTASASLPLEGELPCDGQEYATATYPALATALGAVGATFRVPDYRGRTLVVAGAGIGLTNRVVGTLFGAETVTLNVTQLPEHNHPQPNHSHGLGGHQHLQQAHAHGMPQHVHGIQTHQGKHAGGNGLEPFTRSFQNGGQPAGVAGGVGPVTFTDAGGPTSTNVDGQTQTGPAMGNTDPAGGDLTGNAGANQPHNNVQPSAAVNVFIQT